MTWFRYLSFLLPIAVLPAVTSVVGGTVERLSYFNPGLVVDVGVGLWAWPLPIDYNRDGLMDLVVVCTDKPSNGTWYFENSGEIDPQTKLPLFKAAILLQKSVQSPAISYVTGRPVVTSTDTVRDGELYRYRGLIYPDFLNSGFARPERLAAPGEILKEPGRIRQNQWQFVDFNADGALDLTVGIDFWGDYGWDNAFDAQGNWIAGPLRGYVYLLRNIGTTGAPVYAEPLKVTAGGKAVDPFGMPSPMWGDFDGDGDLDLLCGEFRDGFTYFENSGSASVPYYESGRRLSASGVPLVMDLCMITPVAVDFDGDGDLDVVCGDEDGRVAFLEHTGRVSEGIPQYLPPRYFRQFAQSVKFGALVTPYAFDWDGDGDDDILAGNSAGYIGFIENLGGDPIRWAAPRYLSAAGELIREQAGPNGSIQGPAEAKWGYSILSVADWDHDGLPDIITNGIWGKIVWYKNVGTRTAPKLDHSRPVELALGSVSEKPAWNWWSPDGRELVTQWRTTPQVIDWNRDGLNDLLMLDHEGYLAFFERTRATDGSLSLSKAQRVFWGVDGSVFDSNGIATNKDSGLLQLNDGVAGRSGRRTFCIADWDGDGRLDLLVNSNPNVNFLRGLGRDGRGRWMFRDEGPVNTVVLAGHATKPTTVDWNHDGLPELIVGAEDGFLYHLPNPHATRPSAR